MTTKRKPQGGAKGKGQTLDAQAEAIIGDVLKFDGDTRVEVKRALDLLKEARAGMTQIKSIAERERDLRDLLDKAERGLPVFDVDYIGAEYVEAARQVYRILSRPEPMPDFISNAVLSAITEAQRQTNTDLWVYTDEDDPGASGDYSVQIMARMFKHHPTLDVELEPKKDLPELIVAVLAHDDVPGPVHDKMTDALVEMHDSTDVYTDPLAVRALLDYHAKKGGGE